MYISYINKKNGKIVTRKTNVLTEKNLSELKKRIHHFYYLYDRAEEIIESGDISKHYWTEYRLKKKNQKRRLDIPDELLMDYQRKVADVFNNKLELLFPSSVYGYVKGRNAKALAEVHKNQYHVIKMDIKDFFPNCTLDFIMKAMTTVYPFCLLGEKLIETIIMPCMVFYDGKYRLPQGAPTSPILSNIAMIPIDYALESGKLRSRKYYFRYTRFADDIIISHGKYTFYSSDYLENEYISRIFGEKAEESENSLKEKEKKIGEIVKEVINTVEYCLRKENPNFTLNKEKTKVLKTKCGNIWMLGVTVGDEVKSGNKKKQLLKATLWSFMNDCKNNKPWNETETRHMLGILGYARFIEPDFVIDLIAKYEQKTGIKLKKEVKKILCV